MSWVEIETYDEFLAKNGKDLISIGHNHWLCESGASVVNKGYGPETSPPPQNREARLLARKQYYELRIKRGTDHFNQLKADCLGEGTHFNWNKEIQAIYGPDPGEELPALSKIRKFVQRDRQNLARILQQLESLPNRVRQREREEQQRHLDIELQLERDARERKIRNTEL